MLDKDTEEQLKQSLIVSAIRADERTIEFLERYITDLRIPVDADLVRAIQLRSKLMQEEEQCK